MKGTTRKQRVCVQEVVKVSEPHKMKKLRTAGSDHERGDTLRAQCDTCGFAGEAHETDTFEDVQKPIPPKTSSPIHDPWGLSKLG